jgi:hypothetical protein
MIHLQTTPPFAFDVEYHTRRQADTTLEWDQQVVRTTAPMHAEDVDTVSNTIVPALEDVLLLASLGAGQRTVCRGWTASDGVSLTRYYRRDVVLPARPVNDLDELIAKFNFQDFLSSTYATFNGLDDKQAIRRAIWVATPAHTSVLDETYISRFSGVEDLLTASRRRSRLRFIVPRDKAWTEIRRTLSKAISSIDDSLASARQRDQLCDKLTELNNVSLAAAYLAFCQEYRLEISDLWPMFGDESGLGLAKIRNYIVHGEGYPIDAFPSLMIANQHLKWLLQRMLLALIQWPLEKTTVHPDKLASWCYWHRDWQDARTRLTQAFRSRNKRTL